MNARASCCFMGCDGGLESVFAATAQGKATAFDVGWLGRFGGECTVCLLARQIVPS